MQLWGGMGEIMTSGNLAKYAVNTESIPIGID